MANDTGLQERNVVTDSVLIDTNLSAKEGYLVTLDTVDDNVVNLAAAGTAPMYVLRDGKDGSTTVQAGAIVTSGQVKCIAGATLTPGLPVMSDGAGKGTTATTGKYAAGICRSNAVAGDLFILDVGQFIVP